MSLKAIQELSHLQATSERSTHALTRASYFFLKYIFIKCYFDPVTGHLKHALESGCFTLKFIMVTVPWVGAAKSRILRLTSIPTPCFFSLTCHTISIFDLPQLCKSWIIFLMANYKIHTTLYLLKGTFWLSSLFGLLCRVYCPTLPPHGLWSARLLCPWDSPGKNTEGGLPHPSPGALPDPGIEVASLMSCIGRWILYLLSHLGGPSVYFPVFNTTHFYYIRDNCICKCYITYGGGWGKKKRMKYSRELA